MRMRARAKKEAAVFLFPAFTLGTSPGGRSVPIVGGRRRASCCDGVGNEPHSVGRIDRTESRQYGETEGLRRPIVHPQEGKTRKKVGRVKYLGIKLVE